jgi:hypothetical protein
LLVGSTLNVALKKNASLFPAFGVSEILGITVKINKIGFSIQRSQVQFRQSIEMAQRKIAVPKTDFNLNLYKGSAANELIIIHFMKVS